MTNKQKLILDEMFQRYGSPFPESGIKMYGSFTHPNHLFTAERITSSDKAAVSLIKDCEEIIRKMQTYRIALSERYAELETAPSYPFLQLRRERRDSVNYFLTLSRYYPNEDHNVTVFVRRYTGKERCAAIKAYRDYLKSHPGIKCEMKIEKGRWEK